MPNERQMSVQNEGEIAHGMGGTSSVSSHYFWDVTEGVPPSSQRATEILEPIETFFNDVDAGGVAKPNGSIVAEGRSWNYRHVCLAQQPVGKILRSETELADVDQNVKRTLRFHCCDIWNLSN